jgi:tetratricopeptide (TPR) repeat protein
MRFYERALLRAPRFVPALLGRAFLLADQGDRHRAAEEAVQAIARRPRDPDALELAGLVALKAGRRARAKEYFQRLYRIDRARGEQALALVDVERSGESKWDPRVVHWERAALAERRGGKGHDGVTRALYEERVAAADAFEAFLSQYATLEPDQKRLRLEVLAQQGSLSFLQDLLGIYPNEIDPSARAAIEAAFLRAPTQGAQALHDAIEGRELDPAEAAAAIASSLGYRDLLEPMLERFATLTAHGQAKRFAEYLARFSGPTVALALLAKLERGYPECLAPLLRTLERRGGAEADEDEAATEAGHAVRAILAVENALSLDRAHREAIEKALGEE